MFRQLCLCLIPPSDLSSSPELLLNHLTICHPSHLGLFSYPQYINHNPHSDFYLMFLGWFKVSSVVPGLYCLNILEQGAKSLVAFDALIRV